MGRNFDPFHPYKLAEIYSAGGDPSRHWYVYYFFMDSRTSKFKMFKKTLGINRIKDAGKRMRAARVVRDVINKKLLSGYNPFGESKENISLQAAIQKYDADHLSNLRSRSRTTFRSSVNFLHRYFIAEKKADVSLQSVTKDNIISALNYWMKKRKWSNRQYNNSLSRWRHFFNWMESQNSDQTIYVEKNPTSKIAFLKTYKTDSTRPATEEEFERIVNCLYQNDKRLFLYHAFIYYMGYRVTETGFLHRSKFEFRAEHPYIRLAASDQKDNEESIQYISPYLLPYLYEQQIDKLPTEYFLFAKNLLPAIKPLQKIKELAEDRWRKLIKEGLGIPVNLYSSKHKQATELGDVVPDEEIMKFLRHSDIKTTKGYMKGKRAQVPISFFANQRPLPLKKESEPGKVVKIK